MVGIIAVTWGCGSNGCSSELAVCLVFSAFSHQPCSFLTHSLTASCRQEISRLPGIHMYFPWLALPPRKIWCRKPVSLG